MVRQLLDAINVTWAQLGYILFAIGLGLGVTALAFFIGIEIVEYFIR